MAENPLTRRIFLAKAAPLVAATTMPALAAAPQLEPLEHMRAIVRHFAAQAPGGAGGLIIQIGGGPEAFGYAAYAYVSTWVPDTRLRGGGYWRDDATELSRRSCS